MASTSALSAGGVCACKKFGVNVASRISKQELRVKTPKERTADAEESDSLINLITGIFDFYPIFFAREGISEIFINEAGEGNRTLVIVQ
jgi:hypothetical protein